MSDANIEIDCETQRQFPPMYAPVTSQAVKYNNPQHPLALPIKSSGFNLQLVRDRNPLYLFALSSAMIDMTRGETALDSMTIEFKPGWYIGIVRKAKAQALLDEMQQLQLIRKVSASRKSHSYYINPTLAHCMTSKQRKDYIDKHSDLFGDIPF